MEFAKFFERTKNTMYLNGWSFLKVPMISLIGPRVVELNDDRCDVKIPLKHLTKNHFKSMYLGCQVVGADLAIGLLAMHYCRKKDPKKLGILFKDLRGKFKKRPEADTVFSCTQGKEVRSLVERALLSGEWQIESLKVIATCPKKFGAEPVAEFELTLSVKRK